MTRLPFVASIFSWSPEGASSQAPRVDAIFLGLVIASAVLVAVLAAVNLTFLVRYRRGSPAPRPPLRFGTGRLEFTWIAATTLVFLGFFFWGGWTYLDLARAPAGAYEITVTGRQWMWDARHPNGRREFDELHVPLNRPVRLLLRSEDVIHSFFVPALRLKQDAVPGKVTSLWFEATRAGTYHLFCAEFCGTKHSAMTGSVVVLTPEAYGEWLTSGNPEDELARRGRQLFSRHGCSGCHAPESSIRAPPLEGLYQRLVPLENGTFVRADDRYLRDSVLQPQREIVAGFQPVMPAFAGVIPENDLLDLIAYLKSLRDDAPPRPAPQAIPTRPP